MEASEVAVPFSETQKKLEKRMESKLQDLVIYKRDVNPQNETIYTLTLRKEYTEKELEECSWFEVSKKSNLGKEIKRLEHRIEELENLEDLQNEYEELVKHYQDGIPRSCWKGYPDTLDDKISEEYKTNFKTLVHPLTPDVPVINILMIGETGAGKSSFLNTFSTAIANSKGIKDIYRVSPNVGREESVTKMVHFKPLYIDDKKEQQLPCRFYDMPGIDGNGTVTKQMLSMIINGELKINLQMNNISDMKDERFQRKNPTPADKIHCILYVINAQSAIVSTMSPSLKLMKEVKKTQDKEDGARQFVIVTAIDRIGVPIDDIENAYKYGCLHKFCERVSEEFDIALDHVIPVSNYFEEVLSNNAKNAMSLFNLWRVFDSSKNYIERTWKNL